jgi:hypothetical protein
MHTKVCSVCGVDKDTKEFNRRTASIDGLAPLCKSCKSNCDRARYVKVGKAYYLKNKAKSVLARRRWRNKNPDYIKRWRALNTEYDKIWYENNKEKHRDCVRRWRILNKDKSNAKSARYRAKKMNGLVELSCSARDEVQKMYDVCYYMNTISADIKWHVDHIIPLNKEGLHHPNNLRIVEAVVNLRKGCR